MKSRKLEKYQSTIPMNNNCYCVALEIESSNRSSWRTIACFSGSYLFLPIFSSFILCQGCFMEPSPWSRTLMDSRFNWVSIIELSVPYGICTSPTPSNQNIPGLICIHLHIASTSFETTTLNGKIVHQTTFFTFCFSISDDFTWSDH